MTDPVIIEDEYDLDAAAAEAQADKPRFCFRWKGRSWSLKHMSGIDLRALADTDDASVMRKAILFAMGPEQAALFDEVEQDADVMILLFGRWEAHAGLNEGESSASSASSASTAGRSRPASRSTTRASGSGSSGKARLPRAS